MAIIISSIIRGDISMTAARALTLFADGMLIGGVIEAVRIYFYLRDK